MSEDGSVAEEEEEDEEEDVSLLSSLDSNQLCIKYQQVRYITPLRFSSLKGFNLMTF